MDTITNIWNWIKTNWIISALIFFAVIFVFFRRQVMRLFRGTPRRRRHVSTAKYLSRRGGYRHVVRRNRSLPRSVGTKAKKPWQIKGSEAARRHMAKIRRMK